MRLPQPCPALPPPPPAPASLPSFFHYFCNLMVSKLQILSYWVWIFLSRVYGKSFLEWVHFNLKEGNLILTDFVRYRLQKLIDRYLKILSHRYLIKDKIICENMGSNWAPIMLLPPLLYVDWTNKGRSFTYSLSNSKDNSQD